MGTRLDSLSLRMVVVLRELGEPSQLSFWRMPLPYNPKSPCFDNVLIVQAQGKYGGTSGRRQPDYVCSAIGPGEMFAPNLLTRMKEGRKLASRRVKFVGLGCLILVTAVAGGTQILKVVGTAQRLGRM